MNLLSISQLFKKLAALEFGEKTKWIPEHFKKEELFQKYPSKTLIKEFEKYGLKDFRTQFKIDPEYNYLLASDLLENLNEIIENGIENIEDESALDKIYDDIRKCQSSIKFSINNVNFTPEDLKIYIPCYLGKKKFPAGTSTFKIYNAIQEVLKQFHVDIPNLDTIQSFKEYSKRPRNFWIVFSTQIEDLAGISERGVESCQKILSTDDLEDESKHAINLSKRLIGTILSKYIGVIYLTSGSDFFGAGEKMLYRCLVRLLLDPNTKQMIIGLDKMLPEVNEMYLQAFQEQLQQKSSLPVKILTTELACELEALEDTEEEIAPEYASYQEIPLKGSRFVEYLLNSDNEKEIKLGIRKLQSNDQRLVKFLYHNNKNIATEAAKIVPLNILKKFIDKYPLVHKQFPEITDIWLERIQY